jgi:hypothetical protein
MEGSEMNRKLKMIAVALDCDIQVVAYFLDELKARGVLPAYHFKYWTPKKMWKRYVWINVWADFLSPHYTGEFYLFADNPGGAGDCVLLSDLVEKEHSLELTINWKRLEREIK